MSRVPIDVVLPTMGASPHLATALAALRRAGAGDLRIVVVHQGAGDLPVPGGAIDELIRLERNAGFAAATNHGLAAGSSEWVALVNDDVLVEPGWLAALSAALETEPRLAAVQGVNLQLDDPSRADGWGIGWSSAWQAVQLGRDREPLPATEPPREVFGVSATAALFRREALEAVSKAGSIFDETLGSYYEDVDLAIRLRAAGWTARAVPAARARHAGSATGSRRPVQRWAQIHGNRLVILARLLGKETRRALPAALGRDAKDLGGALLRFDLPRMLGVAAGWARALRRWPSESFAHAPLFPPAELARWRVEA